MIANTTDNLAVPCHCTISPVSLQMAIIVTIKHQHVTTILHTESGQLTSSQLQYENVTIRVATTCTDCSQLKLLLSFFPLINCHVQSSLPSTVVPSTLSRPVGKYNHSALIYWDVTW